MTLADLIGFLTVMWLIIIAVAAFLIIFIAHIDQILFHGKADRTTTSIIQAFIAIAVVIVLIVFLDKLKGLYIRTKLLGSKS
jgi:hypothetical protein